MTTSKAKKNSEAAANLAAAPAPTETAQPAPPKPPIAVLSDREFLFVQGEVTWLMGRSPKHRHLFIADLEWLLAPPLALKQVRIFRKNKQADQNVASATAQQSEGTPVAFVSWAFVSDEADARLKSGVIRLRPAEWRSGPHPWIIDVVAPFGGADEAVAAVIRDVFKGTAVPVAGVRPASNGSGAPATN